MTTLTKSDIEFDEVRFWRHTQFEVGPPAGEVTRWYVSVGYRVTTQEGETWNKNITEEIKGAIKTKAADLLGDIRAFILTKEGI